jgi:MerR family transcriptional regulator, redox-sensitive transcriptional activator SoxR
MSQLTISQVARQIGIHSSAIRYYERIGLLSAPHRVSGQRRYDRTVLHRLALVQRGQQLGFTLKEIRRLFFGFGEGARASERWQKLSQNKLAELEQQARAIRTMQRLLREMIRKCRCDSLDQCGRGVFLGSCTGNSPRSARCA